MPIVYRISPSGRHIEVVGKGVITTASCLRIFRRLLADTRYRADSTAVVDLCEGVYQYRDLAEVMGIARALEAAQSRLKNRIAIVARRSTLFPAEIFSLHLRQAADIPIRVFTSRAAALDFCRQGWLSEKGSSPRGRSPGCRDWPTRLRSACRKPPPTA